MNVGCDPGSGYKKGGVVGSSLTHQGVAWSWGTLLTPRWQGSSLPIASHCDEPPSHLVLQDALLPSHRKPPIPFSTYRNLMYITSSVCTEDSIILAVVLTGWAFVDSTCMPDNFRLKQLLLGSQLINHLLASLFFHAVQDNIEYWDLLLGQLFTILCFFAFLLILF